MINNVFKQGDVESPVLFNMALECVIRKIPRTDTLYFDEENLFLAYTDNSGY